MRLVKIHPKKAIGKSFLKQRPLRSEIELFKKNLIRLLEKVDEIEREENQKNHIRDFLRDTYYKETNEINTKDNKDLVIHLGKTNKDKVGVIVETKRPGNKTEMLTESKLNVKAFQELVLYYLQERIEENNLDIKYLIVSNVYEWYIFEASYFEKYFVKIKSFVKQYEQWRDGQKVTTDTDLFYNSIAKPYIDSIDEEIHCTWFDIRDYELVIRNDDTTDDKKLIALQKLLSPHFLLKESFTKDSNALNEQFYKELLYIIGLEEVKAGTKNIIRRKEKNRQAGSLIENTMNILLTEDILYKVKDRTIFGQTKDAQLFGIALELTLTWINRILFIKLLEGQLILYHKGGKEYRFLHSGMINDYDELYKLFHQVLARNYTERTASIQQKYIHIPYLNSSLFEISELEDQTIKINSLDNSETLTFISTSVLKDEKKKSDCLPTLDYLFRFLDAFDFASEGGEDIAEENKAIINSSVLGKVFEKINGYKDGSIFTPGFITMYMSHQSLRLAVLQKFNEYFKRKNIEAAATFTDLYNRMDRISLTVANEIMNSIRICDPAVGSGHFLVSCLNELIVIKSELGILVDKSGKRLRDYEIVIENDELIISDENGIFEYNYRNTESQRVQETIFYERQTI
ncbi:MAG TPA: class I SAM-dependent DNA methyltransferase, partial [Bacteroidales bacterium]|nr:class I SAM-dependent DNA methyltransferase [Bacteroidales bacterium]